MKRKEPDQLKRGKAFHKKVQADWLETAEGAPTDESPITKPSGRKGRIDILVEDASDNGVAVVEIKNSDWDRMTPAAVRRNVRRQIRQVWGYIESQLAEEKEVFPGIVYPKRPHDPERRLLIEQLFEEEGISVVWDDETIEECKARNK